MSNTGKLLALIGGTAVIAAVIAGLFIVGGPEQARVDDRDSSRYRDLLYVNNVLLLHLSKTQVLPNALLESDLCDDCMKTHQFGEFTKKVKDSGAVYSRSNDRNATLCAPFENTAARLATTVNLLRDNFDLDTGCFMISR